MTETFFRLFVAVLITQTAAAVDLIAQAQGNASPRKLVSSNLLNSEIIDDQYNMSIDVVREQIIDLHKNVKLCLDLEFAKAPSEILPFDDIVEMCAGANFSIVLRFYRDIGFVVKEVIKEKIKIALKNGFCDNIPFMCISFFKALELFIKMDYDLLQSLDLSVGELSRKIDEDKLNYMINVAKEQVSDYEALRQSLSNERNFLSAYFKEQKQLYESKYASVTYVQDDSLVNEDVTREGSSDLIQKINAKDLGMDSSSVNTLIDKDNSTSMSELLEYIYKV